MRHLLTIWPEIAQRFSRAKHILLLIDYDGTLTPIVDTPDMAHLSEETKQILETLTQSRRFTVGIISGRELSDIKMRVGLPNVIYVGNHGMEIEEVPIVIFTNPSAQRAQPIINNLHQELSKALGNIDGVLVENKGVSLSLHYRLVNEQMVPEVKKIFERIVSTAQTAGDIRITFGKKVFEVRPSVALDKGWAVNMLVEKYSARVGKKDFLSIYVGDDQTDEDAFKIINLYSSGISVFVGQPGTGRTSLAKYSLDSPAEVTNFLKILLEEESKGLQSHKGN